MDLTHSFPSVAGDGSSDYIPAHGFLQRPSASWPPPNSDDMEQIAMHAVEQVAGEALPRKSSQAARHQAQEEAVQGFSVDHNPEYLHRRTNADNPLGTDGAGERPPDTIPRPGHELSIMLNGDLVTIKDQIHMYATNQLISHPLVSPVLQPSLGGLPPLLILTGGGELLRDEQIYLAHKAANPTKYPLGEIYLDQHPGSRDISAKWPPTDVQLQVWDDLCHVAPTLSFTRPAKFMFRSIAQFGAWVLARAQKTEIQIMDDDEMSIISSGSETDSDDDTKKPKLTRKGQGGAEVGRAGDSLPPFKNHMIRQRVDRHGQIYALDPPSSLTALQVPANEIGVIKAGPVQKWMSAKKEWDTKYAREKRKVQKQRAKEMAEGYDGFGDDEVPPPSALAGRRGLNMPKEEKKGRSWGMSLWALWGSSHDENTISREQKADNGVNTSTATDDTNASPDAAKQTLSHSRSRSRRRAVTDTGQANMADESAEFERRRGNNSINGGVPDSGHLAPPLVISHDTDDVRQGHLAPKSISGPRPAAGGKAFPFKLGTHLVDDGRNASTITLQSQAGVVTPQGDQVGKQLGETMDRNNEMKQFHGKKEVERPKESTEPAEDEPKAIASDMKTRQTDGNIADSPNGKRRGTLEDTRGVLHHGVE